MRQDTTLASPPRLVLICGLPGSGKTTLARRLEIELSAIRLCPDEWIDALRFEFHDEARRALLEGLFWQLTQTLLRQGQNVLLEFGFWGRSERDAIRLGARSLGAQVELHYLHATFDELMRRLKTRNQLALPGTIPITRQQMERWSSMFQPPSADELHLFDAPFV